MFDISDAIDLVLFHPFTWLAAGFCVLAFALQSLTSARWTLPTLSYWAPIAQALGLGALPSGLIAVITLTWLLLIVTLSFGLYRMIWEVIWYVAPPGQEEVWQWRFTLAQLAALTTVLAAVIALPVTLNRLVLSRRQTETAENTLFNEKINVATVELAARHQVTREVGHGREKRILTEWADDLLTRASAIDRLEGLAQERPDEAPRIARILCLYVRELSRLYPPEPPPQDANETTLQGWASTLKPSRPDLESAVQAVGRLQLIPDVEPEAIRIDLRRANLQGVDLSGLSFRNAQFRDAALHGAELRQASFENAELRSTGLRGSSVFRCNLYGAQLRYADLSATQFEQCNLQNLHVFNADLTFLSITYCDLDFSRFERCNLQKARIWRSVATKSKFFHSDLRGTNFSNSDLAEAYFEEVRLDEKTSFINVSLKGAALRETDLGPCRTILKNLGEMFADVSVRPPKDVRRSPYWADTRLDTAEFEQTWRAWLQEGERPKLTAQFTG